jgi:N-acetylmuramoyl-L-alanine amidase
MRTVTDIVIHCAALPNGSPLGIHAIDTMHKANGWRRHSSLATVHSPDLPHVGYHYVITCDGELQSGRHVDEVGAHTQGNNARSIGICLIGTDKFTPAQWKTLRELVEHLFESGYRRCRVQGHRDYSPDLNGDGQISKNEWIKICPGFDVHEWLTGGMQPLAAHLLEVADAA